MVILRIQQMRSWLFLPFILGLCIPISGVAQTAKKSHPAKKVDVRPNSNDNDIWTINLESDLYDSTAYLSPTVDFSSTDGWDIQAAIYNISIEGVASQQSDGNINLSKTFAVTDTFKTLLGLQTGTTLFSNNWQWNNFDYALLIYQPFPDINFHAGPYLANKALSTTTDVIGYTTGFSLGLLDNALVFQGDYYSGHNGISGAIVNLFYPILPTTQFYMGVSVPETDSGNEFYGISGLSVSSQ